MSLQSQTQLTSFPLWEVCLPTNSHTYKSRHTHTHTQRESISSFFLLSLSSLTLCRSCSSLTHSYTFILSCSRVVTFSFQLLKLNLHSPKLWRQGTHQPSFELALAKHTVHVDHRWNMRSPCSALGPGFLERASRESQ